MIDKTSQLSAIQEKDQQKKLLESKLAQLFYVTCEQELNDESSLGIVSSFFIKIIGKHPFHYIVCFNFVINFTRSQVIREGREVM